MKKVLDWRDFLLRWDIYSIIPITGTPDNSNFC